MGRFDIITEDYFVEKVDTEVIEEFDVETYAQQYAWTMHGADPYRWVEEEEQKAQETPETKSLWTKMREGVSKRRW